MVWQTHLVLYFNTDNDTSIREVVQRVEKLGFRSSLGPVDFVKEWDTEPTKDDIFNMGDMVKKELKGTGIVFNLDTHN